MFASRRLIRIDVYDPRIRTSAGAGIGDPEARIQKLYPGRMKVEPHHYVDGGHYLQYLPTGNPNQTLGMIFETDGQSVTSFRVGTLEAIALVEGCS